MNLSLSPPFAALAAPPLLIGGADEPPSKWHRTIWISQLRPRAPSLRLLVPVSIPEHEAKGSGAFVTKFKLAMDREARRRGFDGVVCGHIHKAEIRMVDGMLHCNDGDWFGSLTALGEDHAGQVRIVEWRDIRQSMQAATAVTP